MGTVKNKYNPLSGNFDYINTTDTLVNDQTTSGYMDIGTMRMQYFRLTSNVDTAQAVTLPAPFADTNYSVISQMTSIGTLTATANTGILGRVENLTTTVFDFNRDDDVNGSGEIMFIAIGLKP